MPKIQIVEFSTKPTELHSTLSNFYIISTDPSLPWKTVTDKELDVIKEAMPLLFSNNKYLLLFQLEPDLHTVQKSTPITLEPLPSMVVETVLEPVHVVKIIEKPNIPTFVIGCCTVIDVTFKGKILTATVTHPKTQNKQIKINISTFKILTDVSFTGLESKTHAHLFKNLTEFYINYFKSIEK